MKNVRTWVEVDKKALKQNIDLLRSMLRDGARFCAVVKANAYGHGLKEVSQICHNNGVDAFAVDDVDDALFLKEKYPSSLTMVLGYTMLDRLEEAVVAGLVLTVYDKEHIQKLQAIGTKCAKTALINLKIETGTSRQGILEDELKDILDLVSKSQHVKLVGVSTHFANIEDTTSPQYATLQFGKFQQACTRITEAGFTPELIHCTCSAAILLYPQTHGTLVRAGISLYGIWPSEIIEQTLRKQYVTCNLKPVLTWKSRIAQIKTLPMGTPISYGLTEILKKRSRIAIVPVGYWDGYDRGLSSTGEVLVSGYRCKVLGRVCMNMIVVDVSDVPEPTIEQEVILIGQSGRQRITAYDIALKTQTIAYEVTTKINPSLPRVVV